MAGFLRPLLLFTGPGDQTVSRWLSGAPDGWVNLPTAGEPFLPSTDSSAGPSPKLAKRVSDSMPAGLNGRRLYLPLALSKRPARSGLLRGSSDQAGPKAG